MNIDVTEQAPGAAQTIAGWQFEIGQCVTHVDQVMPSIVKWRTRGGPLDLYGLRSFAYGDVNPDRLIIADSLRPVTVGSGVCAACALEGTPRCPLRTEAA